MGAKTSPSRHNLEENQLPRRIKATGYGDSIGYCNSAHTQTKKQVRQTPQGAGNLPEEIKDMRFLWHMA